MSEQGDETVNPGQAIYDALSDEAKSAVDALPDEMFNLDLELTNRFIETIRQAHSLQPTSWAFLTDGRVYRNVTMNDKIVFGVYKDVVSIACEQALLPEHAMTTLRQLSAEHSLPYRDQQTGIVKLTVEHFGNLPTEIWIAHTELLRRFASMNYSRSAFYYMHRDDARIRLALGSGESVPPPAYVPDKRIGLPMVKAGSAVPDWLSGSNESEIAAMLSELILSAHNVNPNSWSVTKPTGSGSKVSLDVQGTNFIEVTKDSIRVVTDQILEDSKLNDTISGYPVQDLRPPKNSKAIHVDRDEDPVIFPALLAEVRRVMIPLAAITRTATARAPEHQQSLVVQLSTFIGEDLPQPGYLADGNSETAPLYERLRLQFASAGLSYTPSQIASFYTALQTKGFVVLSGISGTGKSKIAQRFAQMLPSAAVPSELGPRQLPEPPVDSDLHRISLQNYMTKFKRFYIPKPISDYFPFPDPGTNFNVPLRINGTDGEARVRIRGGASSGVYVLPKGELRTAFSQLPGPAFYLRIQANDDADLIELIEILSSLESRDAELQEEHIFITITENSLVSRQFGLPWAQAKRFPFPELKPAIQIPIHLPEKDVVGRLATTGGNHFQIDLKADAKPFVEKLKAGDQIRVTPIIGDGLVSELRVDHAIQAMGSSHSKRPNRLFLPVRPDWRDGKALIGYHNPLSGEYQRTSFLDFVIAAGDDYTAGNRNAFFVILDEMNLAHVEYYFADVLSVIESGRDEDGWTVEGIPLAAGEEDADLPEILNLPPNLYIVGTVNMDETTHPFSPKVLDRAFTIELTEVDFTGYPPDQSDSSEMSEDEKQALLRAFTQEGRYPRIDKGDIRTVVETHGRFRNDLQNLNMSLRRSRMHFGYRVFDEIMQFVFSAEENGLFTAGDAFDHAVLMKVLPKFNGSRTRLQPPLLELIHWCRTEGTLSHNARIELENQFATLIDEGRPFDSIVGDASGSVEDDWRYPATGKRAALMMQDLYTDGFASFG